MNSYENIPIWENSRRINLLSEFHKKVVSYFEEGSFNWMETRHQEGSIAARVRPTINLSINEVNQIVNAAGVATTVTWTSPPVTGGFVREVDVLVNLFELSRFQIDPTYVTSTIERAIGVYTSNRMAAFLRTINPLWWLLKFSIWIARIPFRILGTAGFNTALVERSFFGRVFKLLVILASTIAALLTTLQLLGWLPVVKKFLGLGGNPID